MLMTVGASIRPEQLRAQRALAGLDDATLAELAARARHETIAAGELVAHDGADDAPRVIEHGVAWVLRHGHPVTRLGPGSVIGDAWTGQGHRDAPLVAATPMRLIVLDGIDGQLTEAPRAAAEPSNGSQET
jgi:hypothetical protein